MSVERDDWATTRLLMARVIGRRTTCPRARKAGNGSLGAVITSLTGDVLYAEGYAGAPPRLPHCDDVGCKLCANTGGCLTTVHAEANAARVIRRLRGEHPRLLAGKKLSCFCTVSPCAACIEELYSVGVVRVVFEVQYRVDCRNKAEELGVEWVCCPLQPTQVAGLSK